MPKPSHLTPDQIRTIRKMVNVDKIPPKEVARLFVRATDTIRRIARGEMYETVPEVDEAEENAASSLERFLEDSAKEGEGS